MNDFETFLRGLGLLHKAVVSELVWSPDARTLRFEIDDFYSHFDGNPQYPGAVSGVIELREIDRISFDMDTNETELIIFDFDVETLDRGQFCASISFWPDGLIRAWYRLASFPQIKLPGALG